MNPKLLALQQWLNIHGASLAEDGLAVPATRAAFKAAFVNLNAPAVTDADIAGYAARLGGTVAQVRAVASVESAGGGFTREGRPKILFERHYFYRRIGITIPLISEPRSGGYSTGNSWDKLTEAAMIAPAWALESASWGKFQVMGAHWEKLGYSSAIDFTWGMTRSEASHYEALVRYIEVFGLVDAFRALSGDWRDNTAFAKLYNGPAQRGYDHKLAKAMGGAA